QSPVSSAYNLDGDGLPLIQGNNDMNNRLSAPRQWTSEITRTCEPNDILMSVRAPVGDIALSIHKACIGRGVCAIRPYINYKFVYQFLISFEKSWDKYSQGSTFTAVNSADIKGLEFSIPFDANEQTAIANILSIFDEGIEQLKSKIDLLKQRKKSLMKNLMGGKQRLGGFSGEWRIKLIGDFAECTAGGTPSTTKAEYWDGDIPWMNSGELNYKLVKEVNGRITDKGLQNSSTKILPKLCILIGLAGQGKTRGTVAINLIELCTNQSVAAIYPNEKFDSYFLYYNLDMRYEELRGLSTGEGGRGGLNLAIIRGIDVLLPPIDEQIAIAEILNNADEEIALNEDKLYSYENQKKYMLNNLLTGNVRLPEFRKGE
ncbi:MAG: restriction endonuclease subunit S, partial [Candidatus Taylorbacteria bacterium]